MDCKCVQGYLNGTIRNHVLYLKQSTIEKQDKRFPNNRSLLVLNVAPILIEKDLRQAFKENCGAIQHIKVVKNLEDDYNPEEEIIGFKIAVIAFFNPKSLEKALKLDTINFNLDKRFGINKYAKEYMDEEREYNSPENIKKERERIKQFFREYDAKKEMEKQKLKESKGVSDDDGWTTVTKYDRKRPIRFTAGEKSTVNVVDRTVPARKRRNQHLTNFYTFQIRESKIKALEELRKKSEEEKEIVKNMRKRGKFKIKF